MNCFSTEDKWRLLLDVSIHWTGLTQTTLNALFSVGQKLVHLVTSLKLFPQLLSMSLIEIVEVKGRVHS